MHTKGSGPRAKGRALLENLERRLFLAAGDFDPAFGGGDGSTSVDFDFAGTDAHFARAMAVDPSTGKIILAGETGSGSNRDDRIALTRLNPDGSFDNTFDGDGRAVLPVLTPSDIDVNAVAISPLDGKIVVAGLYFPNSATTGDWLLARFNPDGSPDNTFSGDGIVTLDGGSNFTDTLYGVTVQSDGKIVATGVATQATSNLATLRFDDDGALDPSFNGTGRSIVDFFGGVDFASDVIYQPEDGKIVVVGGSVVPGSYRRFILLRYNQSGTPDNTFDGDGRASTDFTETAFGRDILRQPDGKYVVGGLVGTVAGAGKQYYAFARYNPSGTLDTTFGANPAIPGTTTIRTVDGFTFANYGLARQADGAILFAGTTSDTSFNTYGAVVRLTPQGAPDPTWGTRGDGVRLYTAPGTPVGDTNASDIAVAPDGNIVVAAYTFGSQVNFIAMKLQSGVDAIAPAVTAAEFEYQTRQGVQLTFSEDVSQSMATADLRLERLGYPGENYPFLFVNWTSDGGAPTVATWYYGTSQVQLPDGNYRATLPAGSVRDAAGNPLASDFTFDFYVLAGDANRDRTVDFNDLAILAQNYNTTGGMTFDEGDFNYDGTVDFNDLAILAQRYNTTLAPPAPAATPVFNTTAPVRRPAAPRTRPSTRSGR
jgi:uncharacterized delta-60 repeat protein